MEIENKRLQKIREAGIKDVIEKYKKLYDKLLEQVAANFPEFKDISKFNEKDETETVLSAEEQLYNFALMREKAVDHADRILNKINVLEIELYAPEVLESQEEKLSEAESKTASWAKKKAAESKK